MKYLYHIARKQDWAQAQKIGRYTVGSLHRSFEEDGFIHMSYAAQVKVIADLIYQNVSDLVLLTIDPEKLTAEVKEETAEYPAEAFPHLYGPLNIDAVIQVKEYTPDQSGGFPVIR